MTWHASVYAHIHRLVSSSRAFFLSSSKPLSSSSVIFLRSSDSSTKQKTIHTSTLDAELTQGIQMGISTCLTSMLWATCRKRQCTVVNKAGCLPWNCVLSVCQRKAALVLKKFASAVMWAFQTLRTALPYEVEGDSDVENEAPIRLCTNDDSTFFFCVS